MSTLVKVVFEEDIRRISVPKASPYRFLIEEVQRIYKGRFPAGVNVRYVDDEQDYVTVTCDMELQDALEMSENTLKLFIEPKNAGESIKEAEYVKVSKDGQRTSLSTGKTETIPISNDIESSIEDSKHFKDTSEEPQKKLPKDKEAQKAKQQREEGKEIRKALKSAAKENRKIKKEARKAEKEAKRAEKDAKRAERAAQKSVIAAKKAMFAQLGCVFISDVTVADNAKVEAGSTITKTWLVKNTGKIVWPAAVTLQPFGRQGALKYIKHQAVPPLQPGEEGMLSVDFSVPPKAGKFRSMNFHLTYEGKRFGDGFWAIVRAEKTVGGDTKSPPKSLRKPVLGAHFVKDLNFPDDDLVAPGQPLNKIWLVKNTGECSWPIGTRLIFLDGTFGKEASAEIKANVKKGELYKLTVALTAPMQTGKFTARYMLASPAGEKFGHKYWINIKVSKFPNKEQLRSLAKNFLADEKVVTILQQELPMLIREVRQGKGLASMVETLLKKQPTLASHQFIIFLRPFLQSAEKFMSMQLDALVSMYSFWSMTPFVAGATYASSPVSVQKQKEKNEQKVELFKYAEQLQHFIAMGFEAEPSKAVLIKHKGNVEAAVREMTGRS